MSTYFPANLPGLVVLGGDRREAELVARWRRRGGSAHLFGHDPADGATPPGALLRGALVVAPPSGIDAAGHVRGPAGALELSPGPLEASLGVVAGVVAPEWAARLGVPWAGYRERAAFAWPNAIPTAEGALAWALDSGPTTVAGARLLVAGLGRVGTALAVRAHALGADVVVVDRDAAARGRAGALGLGAAAFSADVLSGADFLFNTVPVPIFQATDVRALPDSARVLDLASLPGGFAADAVAWLGARLTVDRSVPGRVAPAAAAAVLERCVVAIWQEWCDQRRTAKGDAR